MTVRELIEKLQDHDPTALVYTMAQEEDAAVAVTDVYGNILEGGQQNVVLVY